MVEPYLPGLEPEPEPEPAYARSVARVLAAYDRLMDVRLVALELDLAAVWVAGVLERHLWSRQDRFADPRIKSSGGEGADRRVGGAGPRGDF